MYTSRKTIVEYLKKQGYDTSGYDSFTMSEISAMKQSTKDSDSTTCFDFEVSLDNYNFTMLNSVNKIIERTSFNSQPFKLPTSIYSINLTIFPESLK